MELKLGEILKKDIQIIENGGEARFLFNVWRQLCLPFRLRCSAPDCQGETGIIETPPVVVPFQIFTVAEECPRCGRRLSAKLIFVFD